MGPSGGLEGGAGAVYPDFTFVDGAAHGKSCGRRCGLIDVGRVPAKACGSEFVCSLA